MLKILFLCTGNSCRSQMAEGWTRHLKSGEIEGYSAGTAPGGVDPMAIKAMREAGVDISGHRSKSVDELSQNIQFDYVITVCDRAGENCPFFPGPVKRMHAGFEDPPLLARNATDEEEALGHYRRIRDEIREFVATMPKSLPS
ncbi:MAG: arsenate reductase ArsC [Thermodesulfobacteriota bacterium]